MASRSSQGSVTHSQLKQLTCNICRERKVRCDRERPRCQRCRKSGHGCVYPENTDSQELKSALQLLHNRLLKAETKLQEHGLQQPAKPREDTGTHPQITPPEEFMQTMTPQSLGVKSGTSQTVYDVGLQPGEEMDFSDINFAEFSDFDHSNFHQLPTLVGSDGGSGGNNEAQPEINVNMGDPRGNMQGVSDVDIAGRPNHVPHMWPSAPMNHEKQLDPCMNQQFEPTTPFVDFDRQCQPYFDIVQKHIMLVDQQEFFQSIIFVDSHQCKSLKFAVAMSGLHASGESKMAGECYMIAQYHAQRALGLLDGSSFLNIESVQASLLIARYELIHYSGPKGLLTLAGLMQLIRVLGFDMLDQTSAESEKHNSNLLQSQPNAAAISQKIRQTFWIAFALHCNASANFPSCLPVKDEGICTSLPAPSLQNGSGTDQAMYPSESFSKNSGQSSNVFSLFIFAMKLLVRGDRHRQRTHQYILDSTSDYNFCIVHEKIGREIMFTFSALSAAESLDGPNTELQVLALIIILGVRLDWFKTAIVAVQKASFLTHAANEYRDSCLAIANTLCDLLVQAGITDENQKPGSKIAIYKEMSFFILRPLALAAEVHIEILKNLQDMVSKVCLTSREMRQNLQTICSVISMCRPVTEEYDVKIRSYLAFLDTTKHKSVLRTGFLGKTSGMNRDPDFTDLQRWVVEGGPLPSHNVNTYLVPVTVLLQITQYFGYLKQLNTSNPQQRVIQSLQNGSIQGFCVGFLSAATVATSKTEAEIAATAAVIIRLAVCIGAYVDKAQLGSHSVGAACIAVRWKEDEVSEGEIVGLVHTFPGAYVSCITELYCITITARRSDIALLTKKLQAHGAHVTPISLEGYFHSDAHTTAAEKIMKLTVNRADMRLPLFEDLQAPLRSSVNGELVSDGSLLQLVLENTMLKPASWYKTIKSAISQHTESNKTIVFAGFGNHLPPSLLRGSGVQVLSLGNLEGAKPNGLSNGMSTNGTNGSVNGVLAKENPELLGYPPNSIAIVGMSGRFPGADSLDELWELLISGKSMAEPAPVHRLNLPTTGDYASTKWWGNFLRSSDRFDNKFFKKSSREAIAWDPQQRILLEVVYEALESAGHFGAGNVQPDDYGCYIGAVMNNYYDNMSCQPATAYATIGTSRCFISGCMSHYFGWTGPSLTIDTACSSSLVAINMACRAIWSGECSRAVAGGTNVITSPFDYRNLKAAGFLSPSGQCKPFDERADGYCRGEGVGAVVLKPLSAALEEKDHIYGVIVGTAANQNVNLSHITVPNSGSQVKLYKDVMNQAGVGPELVTYVETHGTGTGVGDPVEYRSVRDAFAGASRGSTLHFGSIKGNIGHTEATAGLAGLIKVLLMMEHGKIPQQASHKKFNPKILTHAQDRMELPRTLVPWNAPFYLACVNSYGAAGSNAAALIRQGPSSKAKQSNGIAKDVAGTRFPLFVSATSASSVISYCQTLSKWLGKADPGVQVSDLAFNLADRANHSLSHTFSTTVGTIFELKEKLTGLNTGTIAVVPNPEPVVLVFGGQESVFIGLSNQVYQSSKLLRGHLDACNEILISLGFESLYPAIFQLTRVSNLKTLHAAFFAIQYASAKAWIDSGLKVGAVVGHSFGQITALCISGVLSLADALKLACGRASIIAQHWGPEPGSMLSINADRKTVLKTLDSVRGNLEIACYNGPTQHVVVGSESEIDALEDFLAENPSFGSSIRRTRLQVTHGYHSRFTDPLLPHLTAFSKSLDWKEPTVHLELCTESAEEPDHHLVASHARRSVFFYQAVQRLEQKFPKATFLEAGRGSSVIQLVKGSVTRIADHLFLSPQLTTSDALNSLADNTVQLWKAGYAVQYWPYHRVQRAQYQFLRVPSYQFEQTRHWLGFTSDRGEKEVVPELVIIEKATPPPNKLMTFLEFKDTKKSEAVFWISPRSDRFKSMLKGHVMAGQSLAPASLYFEIAARAALFLQQDIPAITWRPVVQDLAMNSPIGLDESRTILLTLKRFDDTTPAWSFSITTQLPPSPSGRVSAPFEHSTGRVFLQRRDDPDAAQIFRRFETLTGARRCEEIMNHPDSEGMDGKHIYRAFNHIVHYAENFRGIKKVACLRLEAAGKVTMVVDPSDPVDQRLCDTPMTDSFMQFGGFLVNYFNNDSLEDVLVCSKIGQIEIGADFDPDAKEWLVYANMTEGGTSDATSDAYVFEASSKKMVMAAFGFQFHRMSQTLLARMLKSANKSASSSEKSDKPAARPKVQKDPVEQPTAKAQPAAAPKRAPAAPRQPSERPEVLQVLHNITDIPLQELKDESTLDDLGVDSLMATEVLNDIRASLGLTIDLATFLSFPDLKAIVIYVDSQLGDTSVEAETEEFDIPAQQHQPVSALPALPPQPTQVKREQPAKFSRRGELLQVLHNVTDIPLEDLKDKSTLDDLGIDSLMATEVLNDIRLELGLTIDLVTFLDFPDIGATAAYIDSFSDDGTDDSSSTEGVIFTPATPLVPTSAPTSELLAPAGQQLSNPGEPQSRPSIQSAYDSFKQIEFEYDQLAEGTKAANFWASVYPEQKRLVLEYIIEAYAKLGCDLKALSHGDAVPEVQALPRFKQLVRQYYRVLEDGDLIVSTNGRFIRTDVKVDPTPAEDIYQAMRGRWPQHDNVNELVRVIGVDLAECLIGKKDGLQLIFGNRATKALLEDMYANWPLLRTPTILLGDFLKNAFNNSTGSGKFRILEIGAGTGGTTKYLVKYLRSHGIPFEYTFTDISSSLVGAAKKTFKGIEEISFEVLDVEKPPNQDYLNAFHVIIATNCIHATRNLNQSLGTLHKMLRPDGALALIEITQNMFWLDIVVGLFEGWWLFEDNRTHARVNEKHWEREMMGVGFKEVLWTDGKSPESKTVRVIGAFKTAPVAAKKPATKMSMETVVYKTLGDTDIQADIYYPIDPPKTKLPVALMIHGGSHIIFSRKDIRPAQTRLLIEKGFVPVSLDHRLCPEVKLAEGGMVDVCDALEWARTKLPHIKLQSDVQIDGERVVVVGWSSGGQLAMSLAWTAPQKGLRPPEAILAFYCPTNYEDEWWRHPIQPNGAEDSGAQYDVLEAIQDKPITNYGIVGAWEPLSDPRIRIDPRCRIVLHINWKAQTLPVIIGGLPSKKKSSRSSVKDWNALPQPTLEDIIPCSPLAQIVRGNYQTPTFMIHGTNDDLIPWEQSQGTFDALLNEGVEAGLVLVEGAPHICDLSSNPASEGWKAVLKGYEFLSSHV